MRREFGRWRHLVLLLPLGAAFGTAVGLLFHDVLFGLGVGAGFGVVFGLLFAWRVPHA